MPISLSFKKNGSEIKAAISLRIEELKIRLGRRSEALDAFINDRNKIRSYLVRLSEIDFSHGRMGTPSVLHGKDDISSEEKQEISQVCRRIFDLEQEIRKLELIHTHLNDSQELELSYDDLIQYGFPV